MCESSFLGSRIWGKTDGVLIKGSQIQLIALFFLQFVYFRLGQMSINFKKDKNFIADNSREKQITLKLMKRERETDRKAPNSPD